MKEEEEGEVKEGGEGVRRRRERDKAGGRKSEEGRGWRQSDDGEDKRLKKEGEEVTG